MRPAGPGTGRGPALALAGILALAAALRLVRLDTAPPGLNQDEALGAWISWCLLQTGRAMTGEAWPIFATHGIGDYPTTLFFYVLMPFQALLGLEVWTTRLPSALAGIASVWLLYDVGSRSFGRRTGLLAAAFLALDPWHLLLSRLGLGAGLCPFLVLLPVALMLRAGLPVADGIGGAPRAGAAALAGLVAGISCYGFHPMRLFFPAFFALVLALDPKAWWTSWRSHAGRRALIALVAGLVVTAGPLAWRQFADPALSQRWQMTRLWEPGTPLPRIVAMVGARYLAHFHPDFLFVRGDTFELFKPDGQGEFGWHLLPGMLAGAAFLLARARTSRSARLLLALLLAYPAGDVISRYDSVHALRSAPGVAPLALLAAFGWSEGLDRIRRRARTVALAGAVVLALGVVYFDGGHLLRYFGPHDRRPEIHHGYMADLVEATRWLKPRLADYDVVYCTTRGMNEPWAVMLVVLGYDPRAWFAEPRTLRVLDGWEVYTRIGRLRYMYRDLWVPEYRELVTDGRPRRALYIVRPGEFGLARPVHVVRDPAGREVLWLCDERLGKERVTAAPVPAASAPALAH